MTIDLTKILARASQSGPARVGIDIAGLVAAPNVAPAPHHVATAYPTNPHGSAAKPPVSDSEDLRRVLALARREIVQTGSAIGQALVDMLHARLRRPVGGTCECPQICQREGKPVRPCITELRTVQAWALYEIGLVGGALDPISVGHGKTLLDILAPLVLRDARQVLLLAPASLVKQVAFEYQLVAQHFFVPSLVVHGAAKYDRIVPGMPVLHIMSYSRLSRPESTAFLASLNPRPDTFIADECQRLKDPDGAGAGRVDRWMSTYPDTRFCGWSGSLTDASLKDYGHLARWAFKAGSPMPLDREVLEDWARAVDPSDWPAPAGALLKLCQPGEHVHAGYQRRLRETYGVVSTAAPSSTAALSITERKAPELPKVIDEALEQVREEWIRPDGEWLIEQFDVLRCALQLACGFYYRWKFPPIKGKLQDPAQIERWREARKAWHKELREKLKGERKEHLDSPDLLTHAAERAWRYELDGTPYEGELPQWRSNEWPRWRAIRETIVWEQEAVRVDPFLVNDASDWGHTHRGVIWYGQGEFGRWVSEVSGLSLHGGGPNAGELIGREDGSRSIIASIKSHGTGRDGLQRIFADMLITCPGASPTQWEQVLGRLRRDGQLALLVRADYYGHTDELQRHLVKALLRADYVQGTLGSEQMIVGAFSATAK